MGIRNQSGFALIFVLILHLMILLIMMQSMASLEEGLFSQRSFSGSEETLFQSIQTLLACEKNVLAHQDLDLPAFCQVAFFPAKAAVLLHIQDGYFIPERYEIVYAFAKKKKWILRGFRKKTGALPQIALGYTEIYPEGRSMVHLLK